MSAPAAQPVPLDLAPRPGAAPVGQMLRAQTLAELRLTLRRGESVLLTLVIPLALLVFFSTVDVLPTGSGRSIDFVAPGVLALAVLSTAFTGQAIATGFERSYGALKLLGASPLPRGVLLAGKTLAVLGVELLQVVLIAVVALLLGWSPHGDPLSVLVLLLLGTAAFSALGLWMAGVLRAEATLAAANGLYLVLLMLGGIVFPLDRLPGWLAGAAHVMPSTALAAGLRSVLRDGHVVPLGDAAVLAAWALVAGVAAARSFRWE